MSGNFGLIGQVVELLFNIVSQGPESLHGIAQTERTLANTLGDAGYEAHMIGTLFELNCQYVIKCAGKWHLGHHPGKD